MPQKRKIKIPDYNNLYKLILNEICMKILLVIPRYNLTNKIDYEYAFPLGLGYISAVIKKAGYDVDCLNLNHFNGATEDLINRRLDTKRYDVVATGHMGIGYAVIEKIVKVSRDHRTKPKIILGGPLITSEPELMFNALKPDYAVVGEGEITILKLLKCLDKNKSVEKVKGIIYLGKEEKPVFTEPRKVIENIDSLPFPDFEGIGFEKQLENMSFNTAQFGCIFDYPRVYPILCSRGCPFQCTFCYHCLGREYRMRSLGNIMKELKNAVKKYRINVIVIYDDLFSIDKKRLYEFCKRMKNFINEVNWEIKWTCQLSVINVDKEMLEVLKDSGCYSISYGFESYSQVVLKSMRKPITPKQIDNAIKLTMKSGMAIQGNFIFGDVAETKETARETLDYWKKNCRGQVHLGFILPYPGSEIYERCVKKGIIKDKLSFIKNNMPHQNWLNMTEKMSDEEILQLKRDILKTRREHAKYVIPIKISKDKDNKNRNRYDILVKCPFCKEKIRYRNFFLTGRLIYNDLTSCKKCHMRFHIASTFYKFALKHYQELDFFRKNYLLIKSNVLKKRL